MRWVWRDMVGPPNIADGESRLHDYYAKAAAAGWAHAAEHGAESVCETKDDGPGVTNREENKEARIQ